MARMKRWVDASYATVRFEPDMVSVVQGLGRLDLSLIEDDQNFLADFEKNKESLDQSVKLTERFTLSYLWVLGSYELVRTICQRLQQKDLDVLPEVADSFQQLKKEFNRLRVPLAKMEAASAQKNTDSHIAYPAIHPGKGIAWRVSEGVFITRRDLADRLLETLERTRSKDPKLGVGEESSA